MDFRAVFYIMGILLAGLSATMILPVLIDFAHGSSDWKVFAVAQAFTAFSGFCLITVNRQKKLHLGLRETFLLTPLSYIFITAFSALPFCFSEIHLSFTSAFFEAMSGITTTGSTVITGLDAIPKGILFWRALLQHIGGIGFLIIALAIFPMLQISGMQLFKTQSFEIEKVLPSAGQMALAIWLVYTGLTFLCTIAFFLAGMTFFEAICHAMATIATGGFSTSDASLGYFRSHTIDTIAIVFMVLGALPFVLYLRFVKGDMRALWRDGQVRGFLAIAGTLAFLSAIYVASTQNQNFIIALKNAVFMVVTLMTTTGFANMDYSLWGPFILGVVFLASFLGSCSGSTSGGMKIFRLQILWMTLQQQLRRLLTPNGVFHVHYNHKLVDTSVQAAVAGFFFIYIAGWLFFSLILFFFGADFITSLTGALTAISNVGPGLGPHIGPVGNFTALSPESLWTLSFAMMLGRLEFMAVLVILMPRFWRR